MNDDSTARVRASVGAVYRAESRRVLATLIRLLGSFDLAEEARQRTDWTQILGRYDLLSRADASPLVELNRAVAVAMRDGPAAGLALIDALLASGELETYHLTHAARADLCRRLGRTAEARSSYQRALELARQEPERRFLERRLAEPQ